MKFKILINNMDINRNLYVRVKHDDILLLTISPKDFHKNKDLLYKTILGNVIDTEFVSFTQTNDEVSLFISKSLLNSKEKEFYKVTKDQPKYFSLQFYNNKSGINYTGIVYKISEIFSDINIPIIYVNSYDNNYILIEMRFKEHAIQKVIENPDFIFVES